MIHYLKNPLLSEKAMLGFIQKKEQGELFGTQLLPERKVNSRAVHWYQVNNTRELAPQVHDGAEDFLTTLGYEEKTASVLEIREGAMITEQAIKDADLRDLVIDHLTHLTERNVLKQEHMIIQELLGNAGTVYGSTVDWSQETSKPLDDILDVVSDAKVNHYVNFDTMIIDPSREVELLKNPQVREVLLQSNPDALVSGANVRALGTIRGLSVYVANAVYDTSTGAAVPLLNKKTILMKRGSQTGHTMVWESLTARRFPDEGKRAIRLQVFKSLKPVIYRPQNIAVLNHA